MTEYAQYNVLVTTLPICFHEMKKTTKNIADIKYATYNLQNWSPYRRIAIRSQGNKKMLEAWHFTAILLAVILPFANPNQLILIYFDTKMHILHL